MAQVEITILGATDVEVHRVDAPVAELLKLRSENKALADELVDATDLLSIAQRAERELADRLAATERELRLTKERLARRTMTIVGTDGAQS